MRVRYAPSPTGQLHLGGLRTALFNYLLARASGGQFLLRIEDTDQTRLVPGAVQNILRDLAWCGLTPDEGPIPLEPHESVPPIPAVGGSVFPLPGPVATLSPATSTSASTLVWRVLRRDDNGHEFVVAERPTRAEAQAIADDFEALGHKQVFWVHEGPRSAAAMPVSSSATQPFLVTQVAAEVRAANQKPVFGDQGPGAGERFGWRGSWGPYVQSQRLPYYRAVAEELVRRGAAYRCFCSEERLDSLRAAQTQRGLPVMYDRACASLGADEAERRAALGEPHVIRLRVPPTRSLDHVDHASPFVPGLSTEPASSSSPSSSSPSSPSLSSDPDASPWVRVMEDARGFASLSLDDAIVGPVTFPMATVDDAVLLKSDGFPTYHLASVADDLAMGITHVIRGQEWLSSAPKHVLLYRALGWGARMPVFAHLPLLLNEDRTKLSKRQGDVGVDAFRKAGYLPEALVNFVALLGWHPGDGHTKEVYSLPELVDAFSLRGCNKANAVVQRHKLDWLNGKHIRALLLQPSARNVEPSPSLLRVREAALPHIQTALTQRWTELGGRIEDVRAHRSDDEGRPRHATPLDAWVDEGRIASYGAPSVSRDFASEYVDATLVAQHERVQRFADFASLVLPFFLPPKWTSDDARGARERSWNEDALVLLRTLEGEWAALPESAFARPPAYEVGGSGTHAGPAMEAVKAVCKRHAGETKKRIPASKLMLPLRWVLTGMDIGASLSHVVGLIGKEAALRRIRHVLMEEEREAGERR